MWTTFPNFYNSSLTYIFILESVSKVDYLFLINNNKLIEDSKKLVDESK
jgi:hypothetical protein